MFGTSIRLPSNNATNAIAIAVALFGLRVSVDPAKVRLPILLSSGYFNEARKHFCSMATMFGMAYVLGPICSSRFTGKNLPNALVSASGHKIARRTSVALALSPNSSHPLE